MTKLQTKALIASYLEPELIEQIRQEVPEIEVIYRPDLIGKPRYIADHSAPVTRTPEQETEWRSLLAEADILFDFDHSHREDLPKLASNLKWIQATSAGIGQFVKRMGYDTQTDWLFTTASGVHARPLAEFALMSMLMFVKNHQYLASEKANKHWERYCATELAGKTLAIIGLGSIGREVAKLAKAFDMHVIGIDRGPAQSTEYVDSFCESEDMLCMLEDAEFLVLSVPHTPETEGMVSSTEIQTLPKGAFIINIARGAVLDQNALIEALESGYLSGAALDVFAFEPLPEDSPLWEMPNVLISPHSASTAETENAKITNIFCDNLKRYLSGAPLNNLLDTQRLY
ncbi:D-2-hydroxyacid dehydrogenase [Chloroflexota bacterium]